MCSKMEALQTRLERLDRELDAVAVEVKEAWIAYRDTAGLMRKERWQQLSRKEELLLKERQALHVKLGEALQDKLAVPGVYPTLLRSCERPACLPVKGKVVAPS